MWTFTPILKSTMWGGDRITAYKDMEPKLDGIGESWEISSLPGNESVVEDGPDRGATITDLIERYGSELLGERNFRRFGTSFPLLIKFIDAARDLSVQVHPDDRMAISRGLPNGKSEMWYVIQSDKGSHLADGFNRDVDVDSYAELVKTGRIEDVLNFVEVRPGDVLYIPPGRVHFIGSGILVAEIQQTSDATYRIYDFNRRDKLGNLRELHIDEARDVIDFSRNEHRPLDYSLRMDVPTNVVSTPEFSVNILSARHEIMRDYSESDTFVALVVVDGEARICCGDSCLILTKGHTVLIPASASGIIISPQKSVTLLETYIQ